MLESEIKTQCRDYLNLNGWFSFPVHSQGKFSYKGISDRIAIKNGVVLFLEFKTEKGIQSKEQKKFMFNILNSKGHYLLIRSLDDLIEKIKCLEFLLCEKL